MRKLPSILLAVLIAGGAFGMSACTSATHKCVNDKCDVTLKGEGSDTTLGDDGSTIVLVSAGNGSATFTVDGTELTCGPGETVDYGSTEITCDSIGDSEIELHLTGLK